LQIHWDSKGGKNIKNSGPNNNAGSKSDGNALIGEILPILGFGFEKLQKCAQFVIVLKSKI